MRIINIILLLVVFLQGNDSVRIERLKNQCIAQQQEAIINKEKCSRPNDGFYCSTHLLGAYIFPCEKYACETGKHIHVFSTNMSYNRISTENDISNVEIISNPVTMQSACTDAMLSSLLERNCEATQRYYDTAKESNLLIDLNRFLNAKINYGKCTFNKDDPFLSNQLIVLCERDKAIGKASGGKKYLSDAVVTYYKKICGKNLR